MSVDSKFWDLNHKYPRGGRESERANRNMLRSHKSTNSLGSYYKRNHPHEGSSKSHRKRKSSNLYSRCNEKPDFGNIYSTMLSDEK